MLPLTLTKITKMQKKTTSVNENAEKLNTHKMLVSVRIYSIIWKNVSWAPNKAKDKQDSRISLESI